VTLTIEGLESGIVNRPRPKNVGYGFPSRPGSRVVVVFGLLIYIAWKVKSHPGGRVSRQPPGCGVIRGGSADST